MLSRVVCVQGIRRAHGQTVPEELRYDNIMQRGVHRGVDGQRGCQENSDLMSRVGVSVCDGPQQPAIQELKY